MELWDAYRRDGTPAGTELVRGEPIPEGLYHIVCEALIRHADGDYLLMRRDPRKDLFPGWTESSAGGSALKGETAEDCIRREIREETGITSLLRLDEEARFIFDDGRCFFYVFLAVTDCDKSAVTLQPGETVGFRWVDRAAFSRFAASGEMIPPQRARMAAHLLSAGLLSAAP
ncbi:MAG: NUDIX domain-containing protein [Oscillospiraceae bacterium]|nr:NUDIX domain-containing protein [Oscillospiraceae bacterium]